MSEQIDSTPEMEQLEPVVGEVAKVVPASVAPPPEVLEADLADDSAEDLGEEEEVEEESEEESEEEGFSAPEEYVEREKGDRRRAGSDVKLDDINFKNITLLSRFLDRRGRIMSRRKTRVSAKMQRRVVREIKRARHLALLPYTADQTRIVRRRR